MEFEDLANDEIRKILFYRNIDDIRNYCKTNRRANEICRDDYFWQQLTKRDFTDKAQKIADSWRRTYDILSRPVYEIIYIEKIPNNFSDIKSDIFYSEKSAFEWIFTKLIDDLQLFVPIQGLQYSDLSPEFQELIINDDELMENYFKDDPIMHRDYKIYMNRIKDYITFTLINSGQIEDIDHIQAIFFNKKLIKF